MRSLLIFALLGILGAQEVPNSMGSVPPFDPGSPEHMLAKPKVLQTEKIIVFSTSSEVAMTFARLENLGYHVTIASDFGMLSADSLCDYDLLLIDVPYDPNLNDFGTVIDDYLSRGGGVILLQTNRIGEVSILPPGFELYVSDTLWPEWPQRPGPVNILESNPVTYGLTGSDIPGNFETVYLSDLGSLWDVLAVDSDHPDLAVLLSGNFGEGKLVYLSGNIALNSIAPGSDKFLVNMINWVKSSGCNPTGIEENTHRFEGTPVVEPNPTAGHLRVVLPSRSNGMARLIVYDASGRSVYSTMAMLKGGRNEIQLELGQGGLASSTKTLFLNVVIGERRYCIPFLFLK